MYDRAVVTADFCYERRAHMYV